MKQEPRHTQVAFFLPNLAAGGAERSVVMLANEIAKRGISVDLVLAQAVGPVRAEVASDVRIVDLNSVGRLRGIFLLRRYLARSRPTAIMSCLDLPNIQLVIAAGLAQFTGVTAISQRSTIAPVYAVETPLRRLLFRLGIRAAYPWADFVLCNSHAAANEVKTFAGMSGEQIVTIHNSVDSERVQRLADEPLRDEWFLGSNDPLIVSVGSLTPLKDRQTLVRAFAELRASRRVRLAIVGESHPPAERIRVEHLIAELGLGASIYLPGFDPNPYRWMKHAAVVASSSITEGCPNQVLEALALGVPIVATECPGDTALLLGHGQWGRLVPIASPSQMAAAFAATLDDPRPADGRIRAKDFSPEGTVHEYLRVLLARA